MAIFESNDTRDQAIVVIGLVLALYIAYCYYVQEMKKDHLDNRPRGFMGILDHTGSTNSMVYAGKGYGLE